MAADGLELHDRDALVHQIHCMTATSTGIELLADWILETHRRLNMLEAGATMDEIL